MTHLQHSALDSMPNDLSRGHGDLALRDGEGTVLELEASEERPRARLEHEAERLRDVDDDFALSRLGRLGVFVNVRAARVANPARHVEEAQARDGELTEVLEVTINNQVRETILTAEETGFAVVVEASLRLFDGRLERERRRRVGVVLLEALFERLDFSLFTLRESLGGLARGEAGVRLHIARESLFNRDERGRRNGGGDGQGRRLAGGIRRGAVRRGLHLARGDATGLLETRNGHLAGKLSLRWRKIAITKSSVVESKTQNKTRQNKTERARARRSKRGIKIKIKSNPVPIL